jgi:predicted helicase
LINGSDAGKKKFAGNTMMMVFEEEEEYTERRPNLNPEFYALLENTYGQRPTPEQILYYVYAVLYAPAYRQTYAEFLKSDFPRIPFTKDVELFQEMAALGQQITELHLMESDQLHQPIAKFQGKGSNVIAKAKKVGRNYKPDEQRVYINKDGQYFEGIPKEVWEYQIGGYQVLDKWLYDRRERHLTNEEIQHYCRVVTALKHTIDLQQQIDEIYPGVEEETVTW